MNLQTHFFYIFLILGRRPDGALGLGRSSSRLRGLLLGHENFLRGYENFFSTTRTTGPRGPRYESFSSATRPSSRPREVLRGCGATSSRPRELLRGYENVFSAMKTYCRCRVVSRRVASCHVVPASALLQFGPFYRGVVAESGVAAESQKYYKSPWSLVPPRNEYILLNQLRGGDDRSDSARDDARTRHLMISVLGVYGGEGGRPKSKQTPTPV